MERPGCQCDRWTGHPCGGPITQEDLLCNHCRKGCSLISFGVPGVSIDDPRQWDAAQHVLMDPITIGYAPGALGDELVFSRPALSVSFTTKMVAINPVIYGDRELPAA